MTWRSLGAGEGRPARERAILFVRRGKVYEGRTGIGGASRVICRSTLTRSQSSMTNTGQGGVAYIQQHAETGIGIGALDGKAHHFAISGGMRRNVLFSIQRPNLDHAADLFLSEQCVPMGW